MSVKIALIQSTDHGSYSANLEHTIAQIKKAAQQGAQIVCTQELFLSDYFCRQQDENNFSRAEKIPGPTSQKLCQIAKENNIVIIASLFEKAMPGLFFNSAIAIDADGSYLGKYRKSHIPQDPFFEEKFYFAPGDTGFKVWPTKFGRIGVLICWDQWFPESARLLALQGAEILFVPTAIGWLDAEKSEHQRQYLAWREVQRGQAVANACYYAAVNRTGREEPIAFWGQSFVSDFCGEILTSATQDREEILYADCDLESLRNHRNIWPFFRDRRTDAYGGLLKRGDDA